MQDGSPGGPRQRWAECRDRTPAFPLVVDRMEAEVQEAAAGDSQWNSHPAQTEVWSNQRVPCNDGGISLGQAALAAFNRVDGSSCRGDEG